MPRRSPCSFPVIPGRSTPGRAVWPSKCFVSRGGPVAVVAGSRVTMPYAMSVLAVGLMDELFQKQCPTVGEALLHAKQRLLSEPAADDQQRHILDTLAATLSPAPKQLADERAEQVLLFNLFGDPLLRLRYPQAIKLEVPGTAKAGTTLKVTGTLPIAGRATVELAVQRGRLTFKAPSRREYPRTAAGLAEFQEVYRMANDPRLASTRLQVDGRRLDARLEVPANASGQCQVCVFIEGIDDCALGATGVKVEAN